MPSSRSILRPEGRTKPLQPPAALQPHEGSTGGDGQFRLPTTAQQPLCCEGVVPIRLRVQHPTAK